MNTPRRRVLFVDDSETCREVVKQQLQTRGYDVTTLDSPFGFGAAIARTNPDLVLVDVYMPALDAIGKEKGWKITGLSRGNCVIADRPL